MVAIITDFNNYNLWRWHAHNLESAQSAGAAAVVVWTPLNVKRWTKEKEGSCRRRTTNNWLRQGDKKISLQGLFSAGQTKEEREKEDSQVYIISVLALLLLLLLLVTLANKYKCNNIILAETGERWKRKEEEDVDDG